MVVERATLADAAAQGIDLSSNAFMLIHGWTSGPLLLEFVARFREPLSQRPMTVEQLAAATQAEVAPLGIVLRTCCILEYISLDAATGVYSLSPSEELDELVTYLAPSTSTARALRGIYSNAIPPFKVPSSEAEYCLVVWAEQRPTWKSSKSKALSILLDGIVLAPLLTSITYFARWNEEGLDFGKEKAMERFDFSRLDAISRASLGEILDELGVGTMSGKGSVSTSTKGALALQRCYSYYVPTSYSPMLSEFSTILYKDAGWGFVGAGQDTEESEIHVERVLNVVGSGAQHQTLFKDLMRHIETLFSGEEYAHQPRFVVDTGSGDGQLLMHVYDHVKNHTPRGQVLSEYPLTMVGVDFNEESRVATAVNLSKRGIPHIVVFGDIGKPADIMTALKKKKVDLSKTLHVRSFLDHDRPYIAPASTVSEDSVAGKFAQSQMADSVHLDKYGKRISPRELFTSLVDHFVRWGDAMEGSFGLCVLEVMMLDVPTTKRFLNDCVSFHFDIVQCLSRQYMMSPPAFAMGAAMAGLVPANVKLVQTYPEQGKYTRVVSQHLVRKSYRIRFAELSDLPRLQELEGLAWAENLQASPEVLRTRLETSPTTNLVCEMDGQAVAVLYMQRVPSLEAVEEQQFMRLSEAHRPEGRIVQLIAIGVDPKVQGQSLGSELRAFALHLARVDSTVDSVIGVTRCRDFASFGGSMQAYVDEHVRGNIVDPIIDFHTSFGAQVVKIVRDFRPEDADNNGTGVLIQYHVKELGTLSPTSLTRAAKQSSAAVPSVDILETILAELGFDLDRSDLNRGFFDYGMDSLELVRVRNKLSSALTTELPATLLLDYPTVSDLTQWLDKDRVPVAAAIEAAPKQEVEVLALEVKSGWEGQKAKDVLDMLERSKRILALPEYQKRFSVMAKKCYPDMMKYILMIEDIFVEVDGAVFFDYGLIESTDRDAVQAGRRHMQNCTMKFWLEAPALRTLNTEILHLTKQDQIWG